MGGMTRSPSGQMEMERHRGAKVKFEVARRSVITGHSRGYHRFDGENSGDSITTAFRRDVRCLFLGPFRRGRAPVWGALRLRSTFDYPTASHSV